MHLSWIILISSSVSSIDLSDFFIPIRLEGDTDSSPKNKAAQPERRHNFSISLSFAKDMELCPTHLMPRGIKASNNSLEYSGWPVTLSSRIKNAFEPDCLISSRTLETSLCLIFLP